MARYYLTQRPPMPGAFPARKGNKPEAVTEFCEGKRYIPEIGKMAWGYVDYRIALSEKDVEDYELAERREGRYGV